MGKGEKPILSVRIDPDLLEAVDAMAEKADCGRAEIVERCLGLGLAHDSQLASWLEGQVSGPFLQFVTHPKVLKAVLKVIGQEVDPTALKLRERAIEKRRTGGKAKPATE